MKLIITMLFVLLLTPFAISGQESKLPVPEVKITGRENFTYDNVNFTRYKLTVTNRSSFSDKLFVAAPGLDPCGLNTAASRTWLELYVSGHHVYGYCNFSSNEDMREFTLSVPRKTVGSVVVEIFDRLRHRYSRSAPVRLKLPGAH